MRGLTGRTTFHIERNIIYVRNRFIDCPDSHATGRTPDMAAQQKLGLLPERRIGLGSGDSDCPALAGQDLNEVNFS
jgi:hypothetical protein